MFVIAAKITKHSNKTDLKCTECNDECYDFVICNPDYTHWIQFDGSRLGSSSSSESPDSLSRSSKAGLSPPAPKPPICRIISANCPLPAPKNKNCLLKANTSYKNLKIKGSEHSALQDNIWLVIFF